MAVGIFRPGGINIMKKKFLIAILSAVSVLSLTGCSLSDIPLVNKFVEEPVPEVIDPSEPDTGISDWSDMLSGLYYVRHNNKYYPCVVPDASFDTSKDPVEGVDYSRIARFVDEEYDKIPTVYEGDALIYYLDNDIMPTEIIWERFADYGYTFGFCGLNDLGNGKFDLQLNSTEYSRIAANSSARKFLSDFTISRVIVDTIDNTYISKDNITERGGLIKGLTKGQEYDVHVYNGTIFNDYTLVADTDSFVAIELYKSNKYRFLENDLAQIYIPAELPTGYYYVNGIGFFRYVAEGTSFDGETAFNTPNILTEDGSAPRMVDLTNPDRDVSDDMLVSNVTSEYATSVTNQVYIPEGTNHIKIVVSYKNLSDIGSELIPIGYFNDQSMTQDIENSQLVYEGAAPGSGFHKMVLTNIQGHAYDMTYVFN